MIFPSNIKYVNWFFFLGVISSGEPLDLAHEQHNKN